MAEKEGRPLKKIDWKEVDRLLENGCLGTEVAACFGMHPNTFYNRVEKECGCRFSDYQQQKRSKGDSALRSKQVEVALAGDKTMLIWLGKQRLKQREPEAAQPKEESKSGINEYLEQQKKALT